MTITSTKLVKYASFIDAVNVKSPISVVLQLVYLFRGRQAEGKWPKTACPLAKHLANVKRMLYIAITISNEVINMSKTATINMRVNPEVKSNAESIFASLGMSLTEAINVFLHKSIMEGGLPFDVRQPRYNATTEAAMREARDIMAGKVKAESYDSASELFSSLGK